MAMPDQLEPACRSPRNDRHPRLRVSDVMESQCSLCWWSQPVDATLRGSMQLTNVRIRLAYLFERRQVAGAVPNVFLKAREKAASEL
jgi:hypothetical protein